LTPGRWTEGRGDSGAKRSAKLQTRFSGEIENHRALKAPPSRGVSGKLRNEEPRSGGGPPRCRKKNVNAGRKGQRKGIGSPKAPFHLIIGYQG